MMTTSSPMKAKPRSIVIPRSFSSFRRSVSIPVRALTRAVLPWSMCPAVPTTTCFIGVSRVMLSLHQLRDGAGEVLEVPVLHGPEVEEETVLLDPADHRGGSAAEALIQDMGRVVGIAEGEDRGRQLGERERATPDLA